MSSKSTFIHGSRKRRGFLDLPGEVRNQIYHYHFQDEFRCEIAANQSTFDQLGGKQAKNIKLCVGITKPKTTALRQPHRNHCESTVKKIRVSRHLGVRHQRVQRETTKWETSLCPLILVCKLLHKETIPFLYQNTTFVFDAPKRISNFFNHVPMKNLSCITKWELHYIPYLGIGLNDENKLWKPNHKNFAKAHHVAWILACKTASKKLVNLQSLTLSIYGSYPPRFFDLRQDIVKPFLHFRRISMPGSHNRPCPTLKSVKVNFTSHWSRADTFYGNEPLTKASKELHKLYGEAIGKAILGANETDAMAELVEAWDGEYAMWKHHLCFLNTGW